ncbi:MAG: G/T mismatches repair enzyme [Methanocella sp. PtaU1.Bin125]|nr:MAG: G/T mismatches repair enzyme [Methanocella sp. PtaU1.Bin125]
MSHKKELLEIYGALLACFGHRGWWPGAESPFEVVIGALLAQNVAWANAKQAVDNLKAAGLMSPEKLYAAHAEEIAPLIRPSRFYNMKTIKIKDFMRFFNDEYDLDMGGMAREEPGVLRKKLLGVKGLGKETADTILCYACDMPVFVVDAYTKRIFARYGIISPGAEYDEIQAVFMSNLPEDVVLYNDFHAQIVHLGNAVCKTDPVCDRCPLCRTCDRRRD